MKTLSVVSRICCFLCAVLMLGMILIQFAPYWIENEGEEGEQTVSMAEITWFPTKHKDLTRDWKKVMKTYEDAEGNALEFSMNGLVPMPILSMAAAFFGFFVCLIKNKSWGSALLPIISGGAMAYTLMNHPIQKLGMHCNSFLILSIVTIAVAAVCLITGIAASVVGDVAARKAAKK